MPYKASNSTVLVKRKGRWVRFRVADSPEKAKKMATALNMEHQRRKGNKDLPPRKE